jgi:hypothetical protein
MVEAEPTLDKEKTIIRQNENATRKKMNWSLQLGFNYMQHLQLKCHYACWTVTFDHSCKQYGLWMENKSQQNSFSSFD